MPARRTCTRTSPGPGAGGSKSSRRIRRPRSRNSARMAEKRRPAPAWSVGLVRAGETPRPHDIREAPRRVLDRPGQLGVASHEPGPEGGEQAQEVMGDEHLAVAVGAGPDADRRYGEAFGDLLAERGGDLLQHDRERA